MIRFVRRFASIGLLRGGGVLAGAVGAATAAATAGERTRSLVSRAALIADLDSMLATIERVHPNPYTVVSRDSVRAARDAIVAQLPDSADADDHRGRRSPASPRCSATATPSVAPPSDEVLGFMAFGGADVSRSDDRSPTRRRSPSRRTCSATRLLRRGDEIVAVNGHRADSLLRVFAAEIGGETERWREQVAARQFETFLLLNGIRAPFTVDVRASQLGGTSQVALRGIGRDSLMAYNAARHRGATGDGDGVARTSRTGSCRRHRRT